MAYQDVKLEERRRESPSGFHYYSTYRDCPRKWLLKYPYGLRPDKTSPPLLFGGAMHDALEVYYTNNGNIDMAMDRFRRFLADRSPDYADSQKYTEDLNRGPKMLTTFHEKVGKEDFQKYDILEAEKQYTIPVGPEDNPLNFTVRPDRVFRDKQTKVVKVVETKTTGWSIDKMFQSVEKGDQVTSYIWAVQKIHPEWNVEGCFIDVMYNRQSVFDARRVGTAFRNKNDLRVFEMGLYGTILEVTQKYLALEKTPWPLLFPCNRGHCSLFGCEYEPICFTNLTTEEVPPGFIKDDWKQEMSAAMKVAQTFKL